MDELRIVLLGKQGAGKSASGNTLLRKQSFHTVASSERVTKACSMSTCTVDKQTIKVIDTPGWCDDSSLFETDVKQEIIKCISISNPGPHVFLLVLPIGRFTSEELNSVMNILKEFGDEVTKYMIVLFTKGDDLEDRPIEDYLKEIHLYLKTIIQICGQRYHVFNNRDKGNHHQVSSLLKKINEMVERNEEKCYTTAMYQKVKDQFRRKADTSVQDKNKNLSESENRGRRNRSDTEEDDGERKFIPDITKGQECCKGKMGHQQNSTQNREHEVLKDRKRDLGVKNEYDCNTTILEDKSEKRKDQDFRKCKMTEQQNKSQNRMHEGLKQSVREEEKRDLRDKKDEIYSCGGDGERNVEKASRERQEIQHFNPKILQDRLKELIKENDILNRDKCELERRLEEKEKELERMKKIVEKSGGKTESETLQKPVVQMEEMMTKQKTTD